MPKVKDKPQVKKPLKKNGYKFPDKLPKGEILKDIARKEWVLGDSIGKGGFGEIYSAKSTEGRKEEYVIKIEPHENGPLFMEKKFYMQFAKPSDVEEWKEKNNIKVLGVSAYLGSGTHTHNDTKYRFLVMDRYGKDLWSIFINNSKSFPPETVYKCALQILDTLQYIHSKEYVHWDIKGANLLVGTKKETENNVFLVDFGLATRYNTNEYKEDPKQANNGTIEYSSRDAHVGVPTRRGDLETLGFNLFHWLNSTLPWENIKINKKVQEKKIELMSDVKNFLVKNYPNTPEVFIKYLDYVSKLKHDDEPDYEFCRKLFKAELKKLSVPIAGKLNFSKAQKVGKATPKGGKKTELSTKKVAVKSTRSRKKVELSDAESEDEPELSPKRLKTVESKGSKAVAKGGRGKKNVVLESDSESEDEPELSPKGLKTVESKDSKAVAKGGRRGKKNVVLESDSESEDESVKPAIKIGKATGSKDSKVAKGKQKGIKIDSQSDSEQSEEETVKVVAKRGKKVAAQSDRKTVKNSKGAGKSWKDAPTIASALNRIETKKELDKCIDSGDDIPKKRKK